MKNILKLILLVSFLLSISCNQKQIQEKQSSAPRIVDATGYVVPKDSIVDPIIVSADKIKRIQIPVSINVSSAHTNIHDVGQLKTVLSGMPKVCTPGVDSFKMPKIISAIDRPFIAGRPEVVEAKDAHIKDQNPFTFSSFSKLQGLKHTHVRCLLQDVQGNIWLGTYGGGVSKFDGKSFTHFTEKEGLLQNTVYALMQDQNENLWFGTHIGASRYDGRSFTHFTRKQGLSDNRVYSVFQEKNGNIWFGTAGDGAIKFDGKSFTHFTIEEGLSNNTVFDILQDRNGALWFATDGGGVSKYEGKSFTHYTINEGLSNNNVLQIFEDRDKNIWFATVGGGVSKFDGRSFTHFNEDAGLSNNIVLSIQQDRNGDMWFGTDGGGLSRYDWKSFTHFKESEGLSSNIVMAILLDNNSNLWFGTFGGGLSKFQGDIFTHLTNKEGLGDSQVWAIFEDSHESLWFGTYGGGVSKYDGRSFTNFTEKDGSFSNRVGSIVEDQKGNFWFGTIGSGVLKYDGKSFIQFHDGNGLNSNEVYCILEDRDRNLWFGTRSGGATKYDGKAFTHFTKKQGLSSNTIFKILQDRNGNIWFGTDAGGVSKFDGKTFTHFTKREGMSSNTVMAILEDQTGNLWFATYDNGITRYDGKHFTHFTESEGLSSNAVLSLAEDRDGNLWFGTRLGLNELVRNDPDNYFRVFGYEDGFLGIGGVRNSICATKAGAIWIGTTDRLTTYHPEGDGIDTQIPNIQLVNIELFNESIDWGNLILKKDSIITLGNGAHVGGFEFESLTRWYNLPIEVSLAHDNNYITFDYIGITQKQSKRVKYQYKLEGVDETWSAVTNRTQAAYSALPAGSYTFKVKAMNREGSWSNEFHYPFTIRPPWWKTWWIRIVYVSVVAVMLISFYFLRIRSFRMRQRELKAKINEATADLKQKSEELVSTNRELEQFVYVASHDLQEPLRTVSNYAELVLEENYPKLDENSQQYLKVIVKTTSRMRNLIRDLLEFSKIGHQIVLTYVDYNSIVQDVMLGMSASIEESGTKISFSRLPLVHGNESGLKRLFQNLISNAIKFRKEDGPHEIEISASENRTEHLFAIKDNGIGIDPKFKDKIFGIFQRADHNDKYAGTGIGLAACQKIVSQHQGRIWVESRLGNGSIFYFTIPKKIRIT